MKDVIQINGTTFPLLTYIKNGQLGQKIGFISTDNSNHFKVHLEQIKDSFEIQANIFRGIQIPCLFLKKDLLYKIDNILPGTLWSQRNSLPTSTGVILTENMDSYLYTVSNDSRFGRVEWTLLCFYNNYFVHFSKGNFLYDDLAGQKFELDKASFDARSKDAKFVITFPFQLISDILTFQKAFPITSQLLEPGKTYHNQIGILNTSPFSVNLISEGATVAA